jgi:L-threonylcarbamoyladenylate synthase
MPVVPADSESIERAAKILRGGGVVAFPTETVYGLGADTFNSSALLRVYELKGRPADNPLIAHVLNIEQAKRVVLRWDERCDLLAHHFWPGPLTIVVRKAETVPDRATAGHPTIAVRSPSHEVARQLLKAFGGPISAPSANRSGHVSPTQASHVAHDFGDIDDLLILDGGPCTIGIESTVLDISSDEMRILRPGSINPQAIEIALRARVILAEHSGQTASPGTATFHYAPRTPTELVDAAAVQARVAASTDRVVVLSHRAARAIPPHLLVRLPSNADQYAAELYSALRKADQANAVRILIERPDEPGAMWDAIRDRLGRAAGAQG